jgi:endonuclease I
MLATRIRRWKTVALATTAVLVGLSAPALTATPAAATTTAYDSTYYKNAVGKTGTSLKSSLHTIISANVSKISYSAVWNALKVTDQDPNNSSNVILLYSGVSRSKSLNGGDVGDWNREHVWAKSHGDFGEVTGPGTDLHHLRPADVQVNSIRGNLIGLNATGVQAIGNATFGISRNAAPARASTTAMIIRSNFIAKPAS